MLRPNEKSHCHPANRRRQRPPPFALPQLVERAGNGEPGGGSVTQRCSRVMISRIPLRMLRGRFWMAYFVLNRRLAEGHYPAIDIEASISRVMPQIVDKDHLQRAQRFKQLTRAISRRAI